MNEREQGLLLKLGHPFDYSAEVCPGWTLRQIEATVANAVFLVRLYAGLRDEPGWPDEAAIVACTRVVMLAAGTTYNGALRWHNVAQHVTGAVNQALRTQQEALPEDDYEGRCALIPPTHAAFCKLIREMPQPPPEKKPWPWTVPPGPLRHALSCLARASGQARDKDTPPSPPFNSQSVDHVANWLFIWDGDRTASVHPFHWVAATLVLFSRGVFFWTACPVDAVFPTGNRLNVDREKLAALIAEVEQYGDEAQLVMLVADGLRARE